MVGLHAAHSPWKRLASALNPVAMMLGIWRRRELIFQFSRREVEGRYRGTYLGLVWSFVTPLVTMTIFTFVFGVVFKARWPTTIGNDSLAGFALAMFAGSIPFSVFAETVNRAPGIIVGAPNYVKKVVFPLEILPISILFSAAFHAFIAVLMLCAGTFWVNGMIPWTVILAPIAILPLALFALGVAWFLSSLGVYFRDLGQGVSLVTQVLYFATPIAYPVSAIPPAYRGWLLLNPLTPMIEAMRGCLLLGNVPDIGVWALAMGIGLVTAVLGHAWFAVTRRGFADVI